jgi:exosortase
MDKQVSSLQIAIDKPGSVERSWNALGLHVFIKILLVGALFYYLFRREIGSIVNMWVTDPSWSHGFLIPFFSLYFINQKKNEILNLEYVEDPLLQLFRGQKPSPLKEWQSRPNYLGLILLLCGFMFYIFNVVHFQYGYFRPLSVLAMLGAVVLFLGGWRLIKHTWLPIFFLYFAIPLPQRYYVLITMPMRKLAATVATALLNLVNGLDATANGVVIDVVYKGQRLEPSLNVADACSGMRLLMAFVALGVAMAYLHYRPSWQRLILLFSTIPIAIFCNIIRVTVTGFIYILIDPKYARGFYHDMLGMAMLPLAFVIYGGIAWFMSNLFVEDKPESEESEDIIVRKISL